MMRIMIQNEKVVTTLVSGSDATVRTGAFGTKQQPGEFHPDLFNTDKSIILGTKKGIGEDTVAEWKIPLDADVAADVDHGYLVIAAERTHSGLHSFTKGHRIRVLFNNNQKDILFLLDKPKGHTTYFHRPNKEREFSEWPIAGCGTVYSWPIERNELYTGMEQHVKIEMTDEVLWDIDYVGLVLVKKQKRFSPWVVALLVGIVAATFGALVTYWLTVPG